MKKIASKENNLPANFPKIAEEWDYRRNGDLLPKDCIISSYEEVWWQCPKGHSYEATISNRTNNKSKCPYCIGRKVCDDNSLQRTCPEIAKEWDYEKNGEITPNDVTAGSGKIVWWRCSKGHSWQEKIFYRTRTKKHLCPICRVEKK